MHVSWQFTEGIARNRDIFDTSACAFRLNHILRQFLTCTCNSGGGWMIVNAIHLYSYTRYTDLKHVQHLACKTDK